MLSFLAADANLAFTVALAVMVLIGLLEGLATLVGFGLSSAVDSLFPNLDLGLAHEVGIPDSADLHGALHGPSALGKLIGWLRVGKIPVLMLLVVFLCAFGVLGLGLQAIAFRMTGTLLPAFVATLVSLGTSLPVTRAMSAVLGRVMPQDESTAISEATFIGRSAVVTTGVARKGTGAQAKLRDEHGQTHYVMVEPDVADEEFPPGAKVLLVKRQGAAFLCIKDSTDFTFSEERR